MLSRGNFLVVPFALFCGLSASTIASASNESLSFRRTASGSIEAVVSGSTDTCDRVFLGPAEVTIEGTSIAIASPDGAVGCTIPIYPPRAYSVVADLGVLSSQSYHVVWSEAVDNGTMLQLSADLNPAAVGGGVQAVSAPTLSWWGLGLLTLALGVLATRQRRRGSLAG